MGVGRVRGWDIWWGVERGIGFFFNRVKRKDPLFSSLRKNREREREREKKKNRDKEIKRERKR